MVAHSAVTIPLMQPCLGPEEAEAAAAAVTSGWVAQGPRVFAFEGAVATRVGADHGVAVSSGTTALHLALVLLGVGPGDEVIVPSLSYIATTSVVTYVGASPVFAEVDPRTQNVTVETLRAAWSARTRAVIAVHQAGIPADLAPISEHCRAAGVDLVEDAACALGSTYRGRPVGSHSELVTVSFHPRKLITTGEGGMLLVSRREAWAERARRLREHGVAVDAWSRHQRGQPSAETYAEVGFNFRMSDVHAAIGLVQLRRLDTILTRRRQLARRYHELLADVPRIVMAEDPPYGETNFQSFWLLLPEDFPVTRDVLLAAMTDRGIAARRGILAVHCEPAYAHLRVGNLPITDALTTRSLILPMFHSMEETDQTRVANVIRRAAGTPAL
jgi:dTDP-4-amino-4,6-dideoxygalactose transaminase